MLLDVWIRIILEMAKLVDLVVFCGRSFQLSRFSLRHAKIRLRSNLSYAIPQHDFKLQ